MTLLFTVSLYILVTLIAAAMVAKGRDRKFLWAIILLAWIILLPLVAFVNDWMPYAGGGDDQTYYQLAVLRTHSQDSMFDLMRFVGVMHQAGFPWLLSLVNRLAGQDLLAFKLLNLMFLILVSIVWFRIAALLESPRFGRRVAVVILVLTPLWFYVFFLYKDMAVTLLQSLFLLGLVQQDRHSSVGSWLLIGVVSLVLIPFRSPLVVFNGAVLLATMMLRTLRPKHNRSKVLPLIFGGIMVVGLFAVASNPELMREMGIYSDSRIAGTQEMIESAYERHERSQMQRVLFPLLYLLSETAGINPNGWEQFDSRWLRGLLALPWIFIVVPLFLLGVRWLIRVPDIVLRSGGILRRLRHTRMLHSPWLTLVVFLTGYATVSWIVGDSTRWRLPDMPVIATIAAAGWYFTSIRRRQQVLIVWITGSAALFLVFYLFKSL